MVGVRALGIRGCGVSMPLKEAVIPHLDELDDTARTVGAVNTIVNDGGHLRGYNTDVLGAARALEAASVTAEDRILLLGAGGMARAMLYALQQRAIERIVVANRTLERAHSIASNVVPWEGREDIDADVLINTTPIGMRPHGNRLPVSVAALTKYRAVIDAVTVLPLTRLVREAQERGVTAIAGWTLALHQALAQFELYTNLKAPEEPMRAALLDFLGKGATASQ